MHPRRLSPANCSALPGFARFTGLPGLPGLLGLLGSAVLALVLLLPLPGHASDRTYTTPLTPLTPGAVAEEAAVTPALTRELTREPAQQRGRLAQARIWLLQQQRELHRQLSTSMQRLRAAPSATTAGWLILVSFLYGIFHAAGPGHGKAVIATYLLTHRADLRRGILLSGLSALLQGLTAVALVFGFVSLAGQLTRDAVNHVSTLEQISFAMIAALGAWLSMRAVLRLWRHFRSLRPATPRAQVAQVAPGAQDHGCGGCHVAHHVDPARLESRWTQLAAIVSIGMRPCAGAVIVLAVAHLMELRLAGVFAVLAMSLGTALTVSLLASLAVYARQTAQRLFQPRAGSPGNHGWLLLSQGLALAGGAGIFLIGTLLLLTAAGAPASAPLFMTP